jgi:hypothetical protein
LQKSAAQLFPDKAACRRMRPLDTAHGCAKRESFVVGTQRKIYFPAAAAPRDSGVYSCSLLINPRLFAIIGTQKTSLPIGYVRGRLWLTLFSFLPLRESARCTLFYNQPDSLAATTTIDLFFG